MASRIGSKKPGNRETHPAGEGGANDANAPGDEALRRRAEAIAQQEPSGPNEQTERMWPAPAQQALYELRVHQIELKMQNDELRRIQHALDKQRERYFDLYDLAPVGYCTLSAKGLILEANLTAANLLGVPCSKLVKQPLSRFIEKTDQDSYYLARKQLLEKRQAQSSKLQMVTGAGTSFLARLMATVAQRDGVDEIRILLADISERQVIEKALHQSEVELDCILESTSDGILAIDRDGKVMRFNKRFAELWRIPPSLLELRDDQVLLNYVLDQLAQPEEFSALVQALYGSVTELTDQIRFKDGRVFERFTAPLVLDGSPIGRIWSFRDITEREKTEEALRISEKRHRLMANLANDVIWTLSQQGVVTYVSPSVEVVRGFTPAEVMQQSMQDTLTPASQALLRGYFTQLHEDIQAGRVPQNFKGELEYLCKNGLTVWTEALASPILDAQGLVIEVLGVSRDISERKCAEELVRELAYYDPLTGLANRMLLRDRLTQSMASGERSGNYGALMFLDLDNFKPLNDQHGHGAGDLLLAEVARRLKSCVRQIDTVARFGGDEFVVLLDDLTSDKEQAHSQADLVAGKIRSVLANPYVLDIGPGDFGVPQTIEHKCTASIGVALFLGQKNTDEDILKWSDLAMYSAKEAGRNTVCFCDAQMWHENTARQVLEEDLRDAVSAQQVCVYFQAQFDRQNQIVGADALLRWQHPSRGWVSPREFIPKAEKTGLILPMGLWVLESACVQLALWAKRSGTADLTVTVNVSGRQLAQRDFVEQVLETLKRTGANPHRLKLEMKESVLLADVEGVIAKMNALNGMGIGFSLDDFGTGYSSLADLNRLPLDQIKIDQNFVRNILIDPVDAAVVKMVVALAESMEVNVIAEGVETEAQRNFLADLGCHTYQGYLVGPALPAHEFELLVAPAQT